MTKIYIIMNIAQLRRENKEKTLYQRAAEACNADYNYVTKVATGKRKAIRGKALKVKEFLLAEIQKTSNNAS